MHEKLVRRAWQLGRAGLLLFLGRVDADGRLLVFHRHAQRGSTGLDHRGSHPSGWELSVSTVYDNTQWESGNTDYRSTVRWP